MKSYTNDAIIIVMISISSSTHRICLTSSNRVTLDRHIQSNCCPFASVIGFCVIAISTQEICISIAATSNPMTHINFMIIVFFSRGMSDINISPDIVCIVALGSKRKYRFSHCPSRNRNEHNRHQNQRHKLFHEMYLLRFFFRSFSLCYPLSCGILLVILAKHIAFQWCVPPLALFAGIIFHIHVSLSPLESRPSSA